MGGVKAEALQNAPKRKTKQQLPLPVVEAVADKLPFSVEIKPKVGRVAVAKVDMPAGTLVMLEQPVATAAKTRAALHYCHRCFVPIPPPNVPPKAAKGAKALEDKPAAAAEGDKKHDKAAEAAAQQGEQQQNGEGKAEEEKEEEGVPPALDPCLPRYCSGCVGKNAELDARLAAVRSRLFALCKKHQLEPELLQLLLLLDVQRASGAAAGGEGGKAPALVQDVPASSVPEGGEALPALRGSAADVSAVPTMWDRKGEPWRKMIVASTKVLHKELVALAESGAVPGYTPSSLAQLQAVAGALGLCLHAVGAEGANVDAGLGLFPALTSFPHSCVPNCNFLVIGETLRVRTLVDVPAGTPLSVSYVPLYETRTVRRHALTQQRALPPCTCLRCEQPIEESTDRLLEGVWCLECRVNVLVQQPPSEKLAAEYAAQQEALHKAAAGAEAAAAKSPAKKAGKASKKGGKAAAEGEAEAEAAAAASEPAGSAEAGKEEEAKPEGEASAAKPEPAAFWRCCGCGHLEPARGAGGFPGPLDLDEQATSLFSQAMVTLQIKAGGAAVAQAEGMLSYVRGGCGGRLHPYNVHCLDATEPLLSILMRKGDALGVFNTALALWEAQRTLLDLPGQGQLSYLNAIEDAARHKAQNASSAVMKKQFERKAKAAQTEIAYLRKVLYGA